MSPGRLTSLPSQTIGPFFHFALTPDAASGRMARPGARGERIRVRLRVGGQDPADQGQLPSDGAAGATELRGDRLGRVALHAEDGHLP